MGWAHAPAHPFRDGCQRGGGPRGPPLQRGHPDLPDHPGLADGRACRRVERQAAPQPVGDHSRGHVPAERGRSGRRPARRRDPRRARHDVHRVPGPAADDPQHVQDRRRADPDGDPRRRPDAGHACAEHLRRPLRRHGRPADRVRDAVRVERPGGRGLRRRGPCGHPGQPGSLHALLRRLPDQPRAGHDRPDRRADPARPRRPPRPRRASAARAGPRPPGPAWDRPEPRCLLPGSGGGQPVPRGRPGHRRRDLRPDRRGHGPPLRAGRLRRALGCRPRDRADGLRCRRRRRGGPDPCQPR